MRTLAEWLYHLESLSAQRKIRALPAIRAQRLKVFKDFVHQLEVIKWDCPVITVAGTNGKGSCVALLSAILQAAGYRVGAYTSPHLLHYNERIQINNQPVEDHELCEVFAEVERIRGETILGYFEFSTLAALLLFKKANLDVLILEVGMGGRLDPVNSVDNDMAIISSISLDHTHLLGDKLETIAYEKAGIMRSNQPCIWGDAEISLSALNYATQLKAKLFIQNKDFGVFNTTNDGASTWGWWNDQVRFEDLPLPRGIYLPNAACVLQAIYLLKDRLPVPREAIQKGLMNVALPGRFQCIPGKVKTILDVAHNPASAQLLANNLKTLGYSGRVFAVMSMLGTKDIMEILRPLMPLVEHWFIAELPVERKASITVLTQSLKSLSVKVYTPCFSIVEAYQAALNKASPNDVIVVFGSFHTVSAMLTSNMLIV